MLGSEITLEWSVKVDGLHIVMPKQAPGEDAVAFAIQL